MMLINAELLRNAAIDGLREGFINYLDYKLAEKQGRTYCIREFKIKLYENIEGWSKYLDLEITHIPTGFTLFSECPTPHDDFFHNVGDISKVTMWMKEQINKMLETLDKIVIEAKFKEIKE